MTFQLVLAERSCSLLQLNRRFILTWVSNKWEHYVCFRNRFLVSLVTDMWDIRETFVKHSWDIRETFWHTLLSYAFSRDQFVVSWKQNQIGQTGIFDFLEKPRPTSSIKGRYIICKDLTVYCQWVSRGQPMGLLMERWFSRLLVFPVLWSQFLSPWVTTPVSTGIKIVSCL